MTPAEFRALQPVFADASAFPDALVEMWLAVAEEKCPQSRWGARRQAGVMLLTAHHLTLDAAARKGDGTGGMDAGAGGVISESKTVGSVSKSTGRAGSASVADPKAGAYNATSWGQQYWAMVQEIGIGGLVV